ncbi:AIG2-like protein [Niveomyces insectorum RCEF 264]|uniref:Putative gamma-glutamylcyclotransferase n=1 Tax=Niveomyces insectorum RCEF 264 TaxID=1081102 RepID=A0A162MN12_9HYPO|nr:AIG2-like protein [Niveomyces insectorum RCEF 264]
MEMTSDARRLIDQQMREDKIRLAAAMQSGDLPLYDASAVLKPDEKNAAEKQSGGNDDFEPCTFFFYGTLMDPEVLMVVAMLRDLPEMAEAWVDGFEMKLWSGIYPTLLPKEGAQDRIVGCAWRATTMAQCLRLQKYETSAYEPAECDIHLASGDTVRGMTFQWARDGKSKELCDGQFSLKHWQEHHKKPMF